MSAQEYTPEQRRAMRHAVAASLYAEEQRQHRRDAPRRWAFVAAQPLRTESAYPGSVRQAERPRMLTSPHPHLAPDQTIRDPQVGIVVGGIPLPGDHRRSDAHIARVPGDVHPTRKATR